MTKIIIKDIRREPNNFGNFFVVAQALVGLQML